MEDYRELVLKLCLENEIELTENLGYLKAIIKYRKDGINTDYCVKRLWDDSRDAENYKRFYTQLTMALKALNKNDEQEEQEGD